VAQKVRSTEEAEAGPRVAWRPVLLIAGVVAVVHLAVAARYGWHRDEFYYVLTGRHPAWGYVDQPPLTPALARLAAALPGGVLPLRILAIAAAFGCVLLAAKLAAELGGRRRAQLISAAAVAACPAYVAASALFGTTGVDQLLWLAVLVATARALRLGTIPAWLLAGLFAGLGLENKDTIAALLIGIALGLVITRRAVLRTPGPWLAAVLALLIALPNILWNAANGWPAVRMAAVLSGRQGSALTQVPELLLLLTGPPMLLLLVLGARGLCLKTGRPHRWLLVVAITAVTIVAVTAGKSYYAAPALPGLFAAGAVRVEAADPRGSRRRWPIALGLTGVCAILIGLPVLPVNVANSVTTGVGSPVLETYGWTDYVRQIVAVADRYPGTTIFTSNYGEAGALTILGPSEGLHNPVGSGHNAYGFWGPPAGSDATVLCVGEFTPAYLRQFWSQVTEIAPLTLPDGLSNEEIQQGAAIYLCQQPHGTWTQMWPSLKRLS
jgi:4-amino-4-deoxy-L-arabinose transferase-like glycosyltransferase